MSDIKQNYKKTFMILYSRLLEKYRNDNENNDDTTLTTIYSVLGRYSMLFMYMFSVISFRTAG